MQKRMVRRVCGALWMAMIALWSYGPQSTLRMAHAAEHLFAGNYVGSAPRGGGSVTFTFTVDERGSVGGKIAAPNGKQLDLVGAMQTNGMMTLAAQDFGDTNYMASVSGQWTRAANGSVTGSGPFADNSTQNGGEVRTWTGRRTSVPPTKRTISGRVVNSQGVGIPNVFISRSGTTEVRTTEVRTTDSNGNYSFANVTPGTYTITATRSDLTLSPATRSVVVGNANVTVPSITALFKISGQVLLPNGVGVANVRVIRSGSSAAVLTNSRGEWSFSSVPAGNISVSVSRTGLVFTPASRVVKVATANVANVRFATSYSITGRVVNSAGVGIAGVTVTRSGDGRTASTITNASGNYGFSGLGSGSFFVTPTRAGLTFAPFTQRVALRNGSVVVPNFRALFSLTGRVITGAGVGIPNVRVTRSGSATAVFTNSSGIYSFADVVSGNVAVSVSLAGYTFAPASRTIAVGIAPVTLSGFIGTPITPLRKTLNTLSRSILKGDDITLVFSGSVDADTATHVEHYRVLVNGQVVNIESVSFSGATSTVTLGLPEGSLQSGDRVDVQWHQLQDNTGRELGGSIALTR